MTKNINTNFYYNEEVRKCKIIDDVMSKNGLIQRLVKDILENILEGEMEEHLGRNKYERKEALDESKKNYRNGYSTKNLRSSFGNVDLDAPSDRNSEFEPQIIKNMKLYVQN